MYTISVERNDKQTRRIKMKITKDNNEAKYIGNMFEKAYNEHNMYNDVYELKSDGDIYIEKVKENNNKYLLHNHKNGMTYGFYKTLEEAQVKALEICNF